MKQKEIPSTKNDAQSVHFGWVLAGGVAACMAVTFTNPIELIKTRMQLQGELVKNPKMQLCCIRIRYKLLR